MSTRAYILVSNITAMLPAQVDCLRRNVAGLTGVVVVQDVSCLRCRVVAPLAVDAERLGAGYVQAPNVAAEWPWAQAKLYDWIMRELVRQQPEDIALVIHADSFLPVAFDPEACLGSYKCAGASNPMQGDGDYVIHTCWLLLRRALITGLERILYVSTMEPFLSVPRSPPDCELLSHLRGDSPEQYFAYGHWLHLGGSALLDNAETLRRFQVLADSYGLLQPGVQQQQIAQPQTPLALASRYMTSRRRWVEAGRPVRTDNEVQSLLAVCQSCPNGGSGARKLVRRCRLCGCRVNNRRFLNKLRWSTESCPDVPPRW